MANELGNPPIFGHNKHGHTPDSKALLRCKEGQGQVTNIGLVIKIIETSFPGL